MRKVYENEMRALEAGSITTGEDGLKITLGNYEITINLLNFDEDTFWGVKLSTTAGGRIFALGFYDFAFVNIVNIGNVKFGLKDVFKDSDN